MKVFMIAVPNVCSLVFAQREHAERYIANAGHMFESEEARVLFRQVAHIEEAEVSSYDVNPDVAFAQAFAAPHEAGNAVPS